MMVGMIFRLWKINLSLNVSISLAIDLSLIIAITPYTYDPKYGHWIASNDINDSGAPVNIVCGRRRARRGRSMHREFNCGVPVQEISVPVNQQIQCEIYEGKYADDRVMEWVRECEENVNLIDDAKNLPGQLYTWCINYR